MRNLGRLQIYAFCYVSIDTHKFCTAGISRSVVKQSWAVCLDRLCAQLLQLVGKLHAALLLGGMCSSAYKYCSRVVVDLSRFAQRGYTGRVNVS